MLIPQARGAVTFRLPRSVIWPRRTRRRLALKRAMLLASETLSEDDEWYHCMVMVMVTMQQW